MPSRGVGVEDEEGPDAGAFSEAKGGVGRIMSSSGALPDA